MAFRGPLGALRNVAHRGKHGDAAMLQLDMATTLEGEHIAVRGEAKRVPKANRVLDAQLILEGPERRCRVERPITSSSAEGVASFRRTMPVACAT